MTINCRGELINLNEPIIMGILNVTPDSFYDGGQYTCIDLAIQKGLDMASQGAKIIDVGGMSSRPGAEIVKSEDEIKRVIPVIKGLIEHGVNAIISIDTIHGETVSAAYKAGVHLVNDISGGNLSASMIDEVVKSGLPYILMHMQGSPNTMQDAPSYASAIGEISIYLRNKIRTLKNYGIKDIVIDPGFGFGKTIEHNFEILNRLDNLHWLDCPILVGLSRKSMIYKVLETDAEHALNGTSALHMVALMKGAKILRVHDVKEAVEVVQLYQTLVKN